MKKTIKFSLAFFAATQLLTGNAAPVNNATIQHYNHVVIDASMVNENDIIYTLDAVNPENNSLVWNYDKTLLKVVVWMSQKNFEQFIAVHTQTSNHEDQVVHVTLAPKIQEFCRNYMMMHPGAHLSDLDLGLKKWLGLYPDWKYDIFVEMWVHPEDLFRPCVDPNPSDTSCDVNFGVEIPKVKHIRDYRAFYQNLYYTSFRASPGVPWTGMGYSYDWTLASRRAGVSEFILSPSSHYILGDVIPTLEYCQP